MRKRRKSREEVGEVELIGGGRSTRRSMISGENKWMRRKKSLQVEAKEE